MFAGSIPGLTGAYYLQPSGLAVAQLFDEKTSWFAYILLTGYAFLLGFAIFTISVLFQIVPLGPIREPGKTLKRFYRVIAHTEFDISVRRATTAENYDRIIGLQNLSSTVGPSMLFASGFPIWRWFCSGTSFDSGVGLTLIFFGLIFIVSSWAMAMLQALNYVPGDKTRP
jgi:hypothetical protein